MIRGSINWVMIGQVHGRTPLLLQDDSCFILTWEGLHELERPSCSALCLHRHSTQLRHKWTSKHACALSELSRSFMLEGRGGEGGGNGVCICIYLPLAMCLNRLACTMLLVILDHDQRCRLTLYCKERLLWHSMAQQQSCLW